MTITLDDLGITAPPIAPAEQVADDWRRRAERVEPSEYDGQLKVRAFWDGVTGQAAEIVCNLLHVGMDADSWMLTAMLAADMVGHSETWGVREALRFGGGPDESEWTATELEALNRGPSNSASPLLGIGVGISADSDSDGYFVCDRIARLDFHPAGTELWVSHIGRSGSSADRYAFTSKRDVWRVCSPWNNPSGGWNRASNRWFFTRREADTWLDNTLCNHW